MIPFHHNFLVSREGAFHPIQMDRDTNAQCASHIQTRRLPLPQKRSVKCKNVQTAPKKCLWEAQTGNSQAIEKEDGKPNIKKEKGDKLDCQSMQIQDVVPLVISTIYLKQFTWNYKRNSQNPGIARKRGFWPWQDFLVVFILSELTMTHQIGWYTGGVFGTEHLTVLKMDVSHV